MSPLSSTLPFHIFKHCVDVTCFNLHLNVIVNVRVIVSVIGKYQTCDNYTLLKGTNNIPSQICLYYV